jgi:hypothetical protein
VSRHSSNCLLLCYIVVNNVTVLFQILYMWCSVLLYIIDDIFLNYIVVPWLEIFFIRGSKIEIRLCFSFVEIFSPVTMQGYLFSQNLFLIFEQTKGGKRKV